MKLGKTIETLTEKWTANAEERSRAKAIAEVAVYMFERVCEVAARLAAARFPGISPFWRATAKHWLLSRKRELIARVGRRGGKGVISALFAVVFAVYCPIQNLTPGERAYVELLSVDKEEASARLGMIAKALDALGVAYKPVGEEIQLLDPERPVTIRVRAASIRAVGGTAILIIMDEVSRWRDAATGANPAREVYAAIKAELLSQPHGRLCMFSAPYGENDLHAEKFDLGETESQCVAHAATWEANPTITEQDTRDLESNPSIWEREYAARPTAHVTAIASKAEIASLSTKGITKRQRIPGATYLGTMDPSGLRNDSWVCGVWCLSLRSRPDGSIEEVITQVALARFSPSFFKRPTFDSCVADSLTLFREYGVSEVRTDGHFYEAIRPRFEESGIRLLLTKQTAAAITQRIESLQTRIGNATLVLVEDETQASELGSAQLVTHTGGRKTLRAPERKGAHDDTVSSILLAMEDGDPETRTVSRLPPTESDIIVRHGSVNFDPTTGIEVGRTRYFTKLPNGGMVEREPPFGSVEYVAWAQDQVSRHQFPDSVLRWCRELGIEARPGMDLRRLDPHAPNDLDEAPVFVGVVGPTNENTIEARMRRATHRTKL